MKHDILVEFRIHSNVQSISQLRLLSLPIYDILCQSLTLIRQESPIICLSDANLICWLVLHYVLHCSQGSYEMIKRRRQKCFASHRFHFHFICCDCLQARKNKLKWRVDGLRIKEILRYIHIPFVNGIKFWMKFTLIFDSDFRVAIMSLLYVDENGNWVDNPQHSLLDVDIYWITCVPFSPLSLAQLNRNYIN